MKFLGGLLDRIVLLVAVVAAGCVPGFIVQYRQRLGGRLDQVLADLAPFQAIADRNHGGSLDELIRYHLQSSDATFHQEGAALQAMVQAAARLRSMLAALDTDVLHQSAYLLFHHDTTVLRATWGVYQPGIALDLQSVVFALAVGVALWMLFIALWHGVAQLVRVARDRPWRAPPRTPGGQPPRRVEPRLR